MASEQGLWPRRQLDWEWWTAGAGAGQMEGASPRRASATAGALCLAVCWVTRHEHDTVAKALGLGW